MAFATVCVLLGPVRYINLESRTDSRSPVMCQMYNLDRTGWKSSKRVLLVKT